MTTLQQRLDQTSNRPSGFDYLRLILAGLIIVFHSFEISYGVTTSEVAYNSLWRIPVAALLPMFFSLSGFLVAGSLERSRSLLIFLSHRVLRIMPALAVEVFLSALILGSLFTTFTLSNYFSNPQLHSYFANILGDIHYYLPGVFITNPAPAAVNTQLWTIPYELICYLVLTGFALCGIYKKKWLLTAFLIFAFSFIIYGTDWQFHSRPWSVNGTTLVLTFIAGVVTYRFREAIPWNIELFAFSSFTALILLGIPSLDIFAAVPIAYTTIYLGLLHPTRNRMLLSGDYSYGMFLYGCAVQQSVAFLFPSLREWYWNTIIALPIITSIAVFSWWLIEKPVLSLRKHLN